MCFFIQLVCTRVASLSQVSALTPILKCVGGGGEIRTHGPG